MILRATAKIEGEITTAKLQVEDGAQFSGNCRMSNFVSSSKNATSTVKEDVVY